MQSLDQFFNDHDWRLLLALMAVFILNLCSCKETLPNLTLKEEVKQNSIKENTLSYSIGWRDGLEHGFAFQAQGWDIKPSIDKRYRRDSCAFDNALRVKIGQ